MDRDRQALNWLYGGGYFAVVGALLLAGFSGIALIAGFPVPLAGHPVLLLLLSAAVGYLAGRGVGRLVFEGSGRAAQSFYMPSGAGSAYTIQHSHIDTLEARGDYQGAVAEWDRLAIAHPGNAWPLIRAGELYLRVLKDPAQALDRFRTARDVPGIAREHHIYVSQKIIDLYLGPLADEGRALVELRRFVEAHDGTREAALAREAIGRLKENRQP